MSDDVAFKKPKQMGRPCKISQDIQDRIVMLLRSGNYFETACTFAGVSKATAYNWMRRGRAEAERVEGNSRAKIKKSEEVYVNFLYAVEEAIAFAEINDLHRLDKHAEVNPNVLMWRLERRHPSRWGRQKIEADINHSGDIKVNINISGEDDDE